MIVRKKYSNNNTVAYANTLARCNPFVINPEKAPQCIRKRYGDDRLVTRTILPERADLTFTTLLKMTNGLSDRTIEGYVSDIARARGVGNPYDEKILGPIREDIEKLLAAEIRFNINPDHPKKEKGFRAKFTLVEGYLTSDDLVNLTISPYIEKIKELKRYFWLNIQTFSQLHSPIARQLYKFFKSQQFMNRENWKYQIGLNKLCYYINYNIDDIPWWKVRQTVSKNLETLKSKGLIKRYQIDSKTNKNDGGMVTVYGKKTERKQTISLPEAQPKQLNQQKTTKQIAYAEEVQIVREHLMEFDTKGYYSERKLIQSLRMLDDYLKPYAVAISYGLDKSFEQAKKRSLNRFVSAYCEWLDGSYGDKQIKYYSASLFDPANELFKRFIADLQNEIRLLDSDAYEKELKWEQHDSGEAEKRDEERLQRRYVEEGQFW